MKYFKVTVKFGHVGKNKYYKGNLFLCAENGREAAKKARTCPRVKHDHKDAIIAVEEISKNDFTIGRLKNSEKCYFSCYNIQQQRECFYEIEDDIYREERTEMELARISKRHSLKHLYNDDPEYYLYKKRKSLNCFVA